MIGLAVIAILAGCDASDSGNDRMDVKERHEKERSEASQKMEDAGNVYMSAIRMVASATAAEKFDRMMLQDAKTPGMALERNKSWEDSVRELADLKKEAEKVLSRAENLEMSQGPTDLDWRVADLRAYRDQLEPGLRLQPRAILGNMRLLEPCG